MPDCHRGTTAGGDHGMDFATWASQYTWDSHIKVRVLTITAR